MFLLSLKKAVYPNGIDYIFRIDKIVMAKNKEGVKSILKKNIERWKRIFACVMAMVIGISGIISFNSHALETEEEENSLSGNKTVSTKGAIAISKDKVTYEKTDAYVYEIYANGMPLIIIASSVVGYGEIYVDLNENGIAEVGEELTAYRGDDTNGMYYREGVGYWLKNAIIYGGAKEGDQAYDTRIKVTGAGNINNSHTVYSIYSGSKSGTLTGNTDITVEGVNVDFICVSEGKFNNVSVSLKDTKILTGLYLNSPISGELDITFENSASENFVISTDVLANAKDTRLSYLNCGSADKAWGEYNPLDPYSLQNAENPALSLVYWAHNRFKSITLTDSYMNFLDVSTSNEELGLIEATDSLIIDGGALRIVGNQISNMPNTMFLNSPLLLRTSDNSSICFEGATIDGTAGVKWLSADGKNIPEKANFSIVQTESDIPNDTFTAAREGYGLWSNSIYHSSNGWWGKAWYTEAADNICTCRLPYKGLKYNMFILPEGKNEGEFILQDMLADNTGYENTCKMLEHQKTAPIVRYSLIEGGQTVESASIEDNRLTVRGLGTLSVRVDRELNKKTDFYTGNIRIIRAPKEGMFTVVHEAEENLVFNFEGWDVKSYAIYDFSNGSRINITDSCIIEQNEGKFQFTVPKSYLTGMDLGEYKFYATIDGSMSYTYNFSVKIVEPKVVDNPIIEVLGNDFHYDGTEKEPQIIVKDGDTVISESEYTISYENNIKAGTATIIISDNDKGLYTVSGRTTFEIINDFQPENGKEYTTDGLNSNGWANTDFVIRAKDGYLLSTGNTLADDWITGFTFTEETDEGKLDFYVKNIVNGQISLVTREDYKIDRTAPESCDVAFQGNSVKKEIGSDTFELMFRENVEVTITAGDSLSGIDQTAYYSSENVLSMQQLEQITEWIPITDNSFKMEPEDGKKFIIYGRVIDQAGNATYFGTEGVEFDLISPVIEGVEKEITYYTTQKVTVTDKNIAELTLNGTVISGNSVLLPGNVDKTYIIYAIDKAGNESTLTVTMKPISSLAEDIAELTEDNVTSAHKETISDIMQVATGENATKEELEAIEQIWEHAQKLQARIDEANSAICGNNVEEAEGISTENVQMTDKKKLERAKADLEQALKDYSENYTDVEKLYIEETVSRIEAALDSIGKVQGVVNAIRVLPDAEWVSPENTDAEAEIKQAKAAYDALTTHEQSMVEAVSAEKLNLLLAALKEYRIVEGNNGVWEDQYGGLNFKANGSFSKFTCIKIDGILLADESYEAREGSVIITIYPEYLNQLSTGSHILTVLFTDGEASAEFSVLRKSEDLKDSEDSKDSQDSTYNNTAEPSKTGDRNNSYVWIIALIGAAILIGLDLCGKKRKLEK